MDRRKTKFTITNYVYFLFMIMSWLTPDLPKGTVHPKLKNTNCPPTFGAVFAVLEISAEEISDFS